MIIKKKMTKQNNMKKRKKPKKISLRSFCIGYLLLDLCLHVICIQSEILLAKTNFSFAKDCQLKINYWLQI